MAIVNSGATIAKTRAVEATSLRLAAVVRQLAVYATYAILLALPLAYSGPTYDLFSLPKVVVLRVLTLFALVALALLVLANRRIVIGRTALDMPILAFLVVMVAAMLQSVAPEISLNGEYLRYDGLYTTFNYVVLFLLAAHLLQRQRVVRALTLMALTGVVVALEAVAERTGQGALLPGERFFAGRVSSFFGNPDFLGTYFVLVIPLALGLLLRAHDRRARLGWAAASALLVVALALTLTRGAWIGFAASLPIFLIEWRQLQKRIVWLIGLAVAAALSVALVEMLPSPMATTPAASPADATVEQSLAAPGGNESSVAGRLASVNDIGGGTGAVRLQIWQSALPLVAESPILGTGPNTFHAVFSKHAVAAYAIGEGREHDPDRAHNNYLHLAVTTGLLGLGSYLVLLAAFATMMWRWLRRETRPLARILGVAVLAAWFGYLVQDFFLFGVVGTVSHWWLLMGLGAALCFQERRPRLALALNWPLAMRLAAVAAVVVTAVWLGAGAVRMWQADYAFMAGRMAFHTPRALSNPELPLSKYRDALALAPQQQYYYEVYASALASLAEREEKDAARRRAYLDEAIRVMSAAIDRNPQFSALYLRRAAIYEFYDNDHQLDALNDYRQAVALYPNAYNANLRLAQLARRIGRPADAIGAQRVVFALEPANRNAGINLSVDYLTANRFAEACAVLEELLLREPGNLELRARLAAVFERQGDKERAMAEYRAVLDADPDHEAAKAGVQRMELGPQLSPHQPGGAIMPFSAGPKTMGH